MAMVTRSIKMNVAHIGFFKDGAVTETEHTVVYGSERPIMSIMREARKRFLVPADASIVVTSTDHVEGVYGMTVEEFLKHATKIEKRRQIFLKHATKIEKEDK